MSEFKLYDYQSEAIRAVLSAWSKGTKRVAVVLPTGTGKTVIFSHIAKDWATHSRFLGTGKVVVLVHRDELVTQAVKKLRAATGSSIPVGVVKATRNDVNAAIIVASVQTLARPGRKEQIRNVGLTIIDEAHHAAAKTYRDIVDHFGGFTGECLTVGFSATLTHSDKNALADMWQEVVYQRDVLDMIPKYLVNPIGRMVTVNGMSLSEVKMTAGDFQATSLSEAVCQSEAVSAVIDAYERHALNRPTIAFVPDVRATETYADAFEARGHKVGRIVGSTPVEERTAVYQAFTAGRIHVVVNCMVLTEGYDEPSASCAMIIRPTKKRALYIQMVGRVLRLFPGKKDALVLDVVGASQDHRLATIADLTRRKLSPIPDGMSLLTAVEREKKQGNPSLANYVIDTTDVDLFHRSRSLWLQTKQGVWFIPTLEWVVFLWPDEDGYSVGYRPTRGNGGQWLYRNLPIEQAMFEAEESAERIGDEMIRRRDKAWRKKPASVAQQNLARKLGIDPAGLNTGRLSDAITIHEVSLLLDVAL